MKKHLTLGLLLLTLNFLNANPLVPETDFILSELRFNSEGKWEIELKFVKYYFGGTDGIYISSTSGISRLKLLNDDVIREASILTITSDSLEASLAINPLGDSVFVFRNDAHSIMLPLIFGNRIGASVRAPKAGESIAIYGYDYNFDYSIDKSPSIGAENDSTGMFATIQGKIYDPYSLLPADTWFSGNGIIDFKHEANGNYSTRITSSNHIIDKLYYFETKPEMSSGYFLKIIPVPVSTEPDSIVAMDLHIAGIVASTESIKINQESILKIAPNPIKESSFNYEITIPVKSANSYIEIININGQQMGQYPITDSKGKINFQNKLIEGIYTVRLFVNNKNYANTKIIIAHL